jgi:hypothetical protein
MSTFRTADYALLSFSEAIFLGAPIGNNLCPDKFLASGIHNPMLFIAYIQRNLIEDTDGDFSANGDTVNILVALGTTVPTSNIRKTPAFVPLRTYILACVILSILCGY